MPITISGSTGIAGVDGSAATPAVQGTDTNTGIAFPAADTVAIGTGGTERMRVDSSGNVGIGTSSPGTTLDVNGNIRARAVGAEGGELQINNPANASVGLYIDVAAANAARIFSVENNCSFSLGQLSGTGGTIQLYTEAAERMRLDSSGNLLVGLTTSSAIGGRLSVAINGNNAGVFICDSANFPLVSWARSGGSGLVYFAHGAGSTLVGTITTNGTGVTYGTSSDYRLKNSIAPIASGLATISALKPVTYKWNINGSDGEGFIAHELQEIIPQAVHGEKDAVNEDGSIKPQGVDYSKIVVHLVAAIQELKAENDDLKARLTALEAK